MDDSRHGLSAPWLALVQGLVGGTPRPVRRLRGGEEATVHQLDTEIGQVVLHISPPWRSHDELAWVHQFVRHVHANASEAIAPLGRPGETVLEHDGRCAALYPFIDGTALDRENSAHRAQAAQVLARLHRAAQSGFDAPRPSSRPERRPLPPLPPTLVDDALDAWWHSTRDDGLTTSLIHGDYYRANLLCRGPQLVGVIDWHDARRAPLALELAAATFELCKTDAHGLDLDRARDFVRVYRNADSPVPIDELALLVPLMRVWIRDDAMRTLAQNAPDVEYVQRQLDAFQSLKHAHIPLA